MNKPNTRLTLLYLGPLALLVLLSACSGVSTRRQPGPDPVLRPQIIERSRDVENGVLRYRQKSYQSAVTDLRKALETPLSAGQKALARLYLAKSYFALGKLDDARKTVQSIEGQLELPKHQNERFYLSYLLALGQKGCQTAEGLSGGTVKPVTDHALYRRFLLGAARCRIKNKSWLSAMQTLDRIPPAFDNQNPLLNEWTLHWIRRISMQRLSSDEVGQLLAGNLSFGRPLLLLRALQLADKSADSKRVEELLKKLADERLAARDRLVLATIKRRWQKRPTGRAGRIVLLLPLNKRWKVMSRRVIDGVQWAARVFEKAGSDVPRLTVRVVDAAGGLDAVRAAWLKLALQPETIAVIGPIGGKSAAKIRTLAGRHRLPTIAFAPGKPKQSYPFYWQLFVDPLVEVDGLVSFLLKQKQSARCSLVVGPRKLDRLMADRFKKRLLAGGGAVVSELSFSHQPDFVRKVKQLKRGKFNCIFLPEAPSIAAIVLRYLASQDIFAQKTGDKLLTRGRIRQVRVLGSSSWASSAFLSSSSRYLQGVLLAQYRPTATNPAVKKLSERFKLQFERDPDSISLLGYFAYQLIATHCSAGCDRTSLQQRLNKSNSFSFPLGVVRRSPEGRLTITPQISRVKGTLLVPAN